MTTAELPFSIEEYRTRLANVRQNMEAAGIDVLLVTSPENIYYLTGYHSLGYFSFQMLIVSLDRDPVILTRGLNVQTVQVSSWLTDIEGYSDIENPNDAVFDTLRKHKLLGKRLASQNNAWFFTVAQYKSLVGRLGRKPVDGSGLIERVRLIKSPAEIAYIREAGRCCAASLDAAIDAARAGATENDVAAAAHHGLIAAGSEYLGHAPLIVTGPAAGLALETYRRRPIADDDVVFIEAGGTYNRYNAALSRTVIVGRPDPKWIPMAEASREGLNRAKAAIRPGATSHEVDKACRDHLREAGYDAINQKRLGYAMGIGFPPDWGEGRSMSLNRNDSTVLRAGMVFHVVPGLHLFGEGGVVFSETVLVTETGCEVLTPYSQDLVVK